MKKSISESVEKGTALTTGKQVKKGFLYEMKMNWSIYLLCVPALLFFAIFSYIPLFGLYIAFINFNPRLGILGSEFVGLRNFEFFFTSLTWIDVTWNTLYLNALFILITMAVSIAIAVFITEIKSRFFMRVTQSLVILPHFISWTVIAMFTEAFFSTDTGFINGILSSLGLERVQFYKTADIWPAILVILRVWHGAGFNSIIYIAAIQGIDQEIYEAARIDGAGRWQVIGAITLPMLRSTAIMLLIFAVGRIFYGDFGMIYAIIGDNGLINKKVDIIDTYVYRALRQLGDIGMSAAAGFYQSIIGFVMVMVTNAIVKKVDPDSSLF